MANNTKQGPVIIIESCGCTVDHGIPYRCDLHKLPSERAMPFVEYVSSETAYGRTVPASFAIKVF